MSANRTKWFFAPLGFSAILLLAGGAEAESITYQINVNTSGLSGTTGYLDFQFDPGTPPFDAGSATITGFTGNGTLGAALPDIGVVSGTLPGTVVIDNTQAANEYTQAYTYESFFDVFVTLSIPSVSGNAAGGNSFTLDVEDSGFNPLLSSSFPAVEIDLDATTGNPAVINNTSSSNPNGYASVSATPEPATFALLGIGFAFVAWHRRPRSS
jgi:hypothetical protein